MIRVVQDAISDLRKIQIGGSDWSFGLLLMVFLGFGVACTYGLTNGNERFSVVALLSGSFLLLGIFFGFLFGIPRFSGESGVSDESAHPSNTGEKSNGAAPKRGGYRANTNLEQISDWLTKILVGVGLTQFYQIPTLIDRLGDYFGASVGGDPHGKILTICLTLFFSVSGFLLGYLWTRLFLGIELSRADMLSLREEISRIQHDQAQLDAHAISLVNQFLLGDDASKITAEQLSDSMRAASPQIRVQIFYQAREARKNWTSKHETGMVGRVIPIFQALIANGGGGKLHRSYAQLGYAYKDKLSPDYEKAEDALTRAIDLRGPPDKFGYGVYELARAICRIQRDKNFSKNEESDEEPKKAILSDLDVAISERIRIYDQDQLVKWANLNTPSHVAAIKELEGAATDR